MLATHLSAPPVGPDTPVERLVRRPPVFVRSVLTLRQVAEVLESESIGAVLVRAHGHLAGVISERDVVRALAEGFDPDAERVDALMTDDLATVPVGTPLRTVAGLMLADEIRHMPVVDGSVVMGVVSIRDVLAVFTPAGS